MKLTPFWSLFAGVLLLSSLVTSTAWGIPQFSRTTGSDCVDCHTSPPMLNERGEAFLERGYRLPEHLDRDERGTIPISIWATGRTQNHAHLDGTDTFMARIEPITGGSIGDLPVSYFIEWRLLDLHLQGDGTRGDRSGRFEDVEVAIEFIDNHTVEVGQFRALTQLNASQRLGVSEPAIMGSSLPGPAAERDRLQSVRAFAPSMRSPSLRYEWQSMEGEEAPADGLFHALTLVFPGEFSVPLSDRAAERASFEFEPKPKGLFAESFWRQGLTSVGAHGFVGDAGRWLATALARWNYSDVVVTAGAGMDSGTGSGSRNRLSLQTEYLARWFPRVRGALGMRGEYISNAGGDPAFIPYLTVAGPNTVFTMMVQAEYRIQGDTDAFFVDVSTVF